MKKIAIGVTVLALALAGCGKSEEAKQEGGELTKAVQGATGVAECDDYLTKVMQCVEDKVPEAQRGMILQTIEQSKTQWAAVADKTQLAAACKTAMDQAKASFGAMGCSF